MNTHLLLWRAMSHWPIILIINYFLLFQLLYNKLVRFIKYHICNFLHYFEITLFQFKISSHIFCIKVVSSFCIDCLFLWGKKINKPCRLIKLLSELLVYHIVQTKISVQIKLVEFHKPSATKYVKNVIIFLCIFS